MEIETKNASLDTMAVTIQALHVSGKQMTLAVFRQLPSSRAYNKTGLWPQWSIGESCATPSKTRATYGLFAPAVGACTDARFVGTAIACIDARDI